MRVPLFILQHVHGRSLDIRTNFAGVGYLELVRSGHDVARQSGLFTTEVFQKGREEVIALQQQEMLELSTPVVQLWDGILALPLIGTLDSARTQVDQKTGRRRVAAELTKPL